MRIMTAMTASAQAHDPHVYGVRAAANAVAALQDADIDAVLPQVLRGAHAGEPRAKHQHLHWTPFLLGLKACRVGQDALSAGLRWRQ